MNKKNLKISSTAYRVLLLFLLLNEKDHNIDELTNVFSKDPKIARSYTSDVIIKYINTLKQVGFKITKKNSVYFNRYTIERSPFLIDFDCDDLKTLVVLEGYIKYLHQPKLKKRFINIVNKIQRFLPDEKLEHFEECRKKLINCIYFDLNKYNQFEEVIKTYEKFCFEDYQVIVTYKNPETEENCKITFEPKYVKYNNSNIYLCGYNVYANKKQLLPVEYVLDIKQSPMKLRNYTIYPSVVFKLKGRLANGYKLREGDKIIERDQTAESIIISSTYDDSLLLFRRLIKYGKHCEILHPQNIKHEFINFVKDTLNNYEVAVSP